MCKDPSLEALANTLAVREDFLVPMVLRDLGAIEKVGSGEDEDKLEYVGNQERLRQRFCEEQHVHYLLLNRSSLATFKRLVIT